MSNSIHLPPEVVRRLDTLAAETGRPRAFYVRELVQRGLEEVEDYYLATEALARLRNGEETTFSSDELGRET